MQLAALYNHLLAAEREQNDIDQTLDHIEQQQKDLSGTLDSYEKAASDILGGQGGSLRALDAGPADTERDKKFVVSPTFCSRALIGPAVTCSRQIYTLNLTICLALSLN